MICSKEIQIIKKEGKKTKLKQTCFFFLKKKGRSQQKKKTLFLSDSEKSGKVNFVRKDVTKNKQEKKVVDMRRHWSGFTLKSKFTQNNFHYTCNLAFHRVLWRTQASFFLFWMVGKSQCITTGSLTAPSLYCAFRNLHNFWTVSIDGTCLSITNGNASNLWHYDKFLHHLEQQHVQNDQLDFSDFGLVSSVVFICLPFVSVSQSLLFHQSHASSSLFNPRLIF